MTDVTPALLDELERLHAAMPPYPSAVALNTTATLAWISAMRQHTPALIARLRQLEAIAAAARRLAVRQSGDYQAYRDEQREALSDLRATLAAPHDAPEGSE